MDYLIRMTKGLDLNFFWYLSIEMCIEHLRLAKQEYQLMKQDHLRLREKYLIELQNKARASILRNERVKQR